MNYFLGFVCTWLLVLIALMQQWVVVAIVAVVLFSVWYPTHTLVLLGLLLDGYFGAFSTIPVFSLLALSWFIIVESLRDYISLRRDPVVY